MKKSDVREVRSVGDVTSISSATTAKSGVSSGPAGDVAAPMTHGETSGNTSTLKEGVMNQNPSTDGLPPMVRAKSDYPGPQPDESKPADASSMEASPVGRSVSWPAAADKTSAGSTSSVPDFTGWSTGSKVGFPAAANKTSGIKEVTNFDKP